MSAGIICIIGSEKQTVFRDIPNCEQTGTGTDNVQGQISEHIFAPSGDYRVYYPSNLLPNARSFENWGIYKQKPPFGAKICYDICPRTLSVPRSEQFSESAA